MLEVKKLEPIKSIYFYMLRKPPGNEMEKDKPNQ